MAAIDLTRLPHGRRGWAEFVAVADQLADSSERYFLELKSDVDLNGNSGRMKVVKFILGALNRDPVKAARRFDGYALMVLGVGGSGDAGIPDFEAKDLAGTVRKFIGASADRLWDFERVNQGAPGRAVIVVYVDPPTGGVWTCLRDGDGVKDGGIYVRGDGDTREAKGDEIRELVRRASAGVTVEPSVGQRLLAVARRTLDAINNDTLYRSATTGSPSRTGSEMTEQLAHELDGLLRACVAAGADGTENDRDVVARVVSNLARSGFVHRSGQEVLISLFKLPALLTVIAGVLGATSAKNGAMLAAFGADPKVDPTRLGYETALVSVVSPWSPFASRWEQAQLVALVLEGADATDDLFEAYDRGRVERRLRAPASDVVRHLLRAIAAPLVVGDDDFVDLFDQTETLIAAIAEDAALQGTALPNGGGDWVTANIAGTRFEGPSVPERLMAEAAEAGAAWWPLAGGCFGGDVERATAALARVAASADDRRRRYY